MATMSEKQSRVRTEWQMAGHATIINAEETTLIHERSRTEANHGVSGTPIGCVVQIFTGTGESWGWKGYVYTDHKRRRRGREVVTGLMAGPAAKRECAAVVWYERVLEAVHAEPGTASTDYGYGCGRAQRTYRAFAR